LVNDLPKKNEKEKWRNLILNLGMSKQVLTRALDDKSRIDKKIAKKLLNERDYTYLFKKVALETCPQ